MAPQEEQPKTDVNDNQRYLVWISLAIILIATAAIRIRLLDIPLERDEGGYAYVGQLILQGIPPYAQAYDMRLPGVYAAYAFIIAIFGQTHTAIHLGLLFINAATIAMIFLLAKRLFGSFAAIAAAATFAMLSMGQMVLGASANTEHFVILPAIAGI
jgi:4-amino-4-deoxy-L-arabinose transferase-like glycosyltransferase